MAISFLYLLDWRPVAVGREILSLFIWGTHWLLNFKGILIFSSEHVWFFSQKQRIKYRSNVFGTHQSLNIGKGIGSVTPVPSCFLMCVWRSHILPPFHNVLPVCFFPVFQNVLPVSQKNALNKVPRLQNLQINKYLFSSSKVEKQAHKCFP